MICTQNGFIQSGFHKNLDKKEDIEDIDIFCVTKESRTEDSHSVNNNELVFTIKCDNSQKKARMETQQKKESKGPGRPIKQPKKSKRGRKKKSELLKERSAKGEQPKPVQISREEKKARYYEEMFRRQEEREKKKNKRKENKLQKQTFTVDDTFNKKSKALTNEDINLDSIHSKSQLSNTVNKKELDNIKIELVHDPLDFCTPGCYEWLENSLHENFDKGSYKNGGEIKEAYHSNLDICKIENKKNISNSNFDETMIDSELTAPKNSASSCSFSSKDISFNNPILSQADLREIFCNQILEATKYLQTSKISKIQKPKSPVSSAASSKKTQITLTSLTAPVQTFKKIFKITNKNRPKPLKNILNTQTEASQPQQRSGGLRSLHQRLRGV
ncbi:unnamed protein product [Moneuplotes crassus]|uniref:Uncharacterized protein n=1 Tax=Euplotes crassus TaxID=5936 RepID=A0AAD1XFQ3_EUPCR|nr:unnamed protein product [Moneuplotes crassus]